jgi:hypothetical protein
MHRDLRLFGATAALWALSTADLGPVAGQEIDSAFSDTLVHGFGLPEVSVTVGPNGVEAPADLPAEFHVVTLAATDDLIGYLDIVQVPGGFEPGGDGGTGPGRGRRRRAAARLGLRRRLLIPRPGPDGDLHR